ncbi:MAG: hypothetical protein EBU88_07410 [Acidobacteria bacterium]|nr:hypothetical protein [Acidobacteriota bacterium]
MFRHVGPKGPVSPGARAVVIDDRYSALRERPDLQGRVIQRLGRGRVVGLLATIRNRRGERFHRLAVSRKRSGWVYELATIRTGSRRDAPRMIGLIEGTADDFVRISLARICQREFAGTEEARIAQSVVADAAARVAAKLTLEIRRRAGDSFTANRRPLFLNYPGLDRYNRIGVLFDYDSERDQLFFSRPARR